MEETVGWKPHADPGVEVSGIWPVPISGEYLKSKLTGIIKQIVIWIHLIGTTMWRAPSSQNIFPRLCKPPEKRHP